MRKVGHRWFLPGALPFLSRFVGSCRSELVAQNSGRSFGSMSAFEGELSLSRNAAADTMFSKACANGMGITVYSRLSSATCHKKGERQGRGLPTGIGPSLRQPTNSETEALSGLRESALSTILVITAARHTATDYCMGCDGHGGPGPALCHGDFARKLASRTQDSSFINCPVSTDPTRWGRPSLVPQWANAAEIGGGTPPGSPPYLCLRHSSRWHNYRCLRAGSMPQSSRLRG